MQGDVQQMSELCRNSKLDNYYDYIIVLLILRYVLCMYVALYILLFMFCYVLCNGRCMMQLTIAFLYHLLVQKGYASINPFVIISLLSCRI